MSNEAIDGKVVIITGASSGIGEETARYLADRGARVVLAARRLDRLQAIASDIKQSGGMALPLKMDVTVRQDVQGVVDKTLDKFGQIDVLINNAGLMSLAPLAEREVSAWEKMIDINIKGVLYGIEAVLPVFQSQDRGHFINLSSVAGKKVLAPGGVVYSGTKFAVSAISEGLRVEAGPAIRTTTISPGLVASELMHGSTHPESLATIKAFYEIAIPAVSVAKAIAYAIEQPADVDVNEIVVRPTAQEI